ncbi:DUF4232 domain-containing protein [Streptomyces sp. SID8381]|uniref:DUF4232 domain-containing protein n=1 Tax=unclassified Streptomyces TaxID=2593676 RepID=UPI00036B102A|nr:MULTISPECIES: DUF4232 domain-containing protein [unclassified Streptomyces]MYX30509.1 DUF4232 domain-containing protein [Streptomyces sp. SID8381]
MAYTSPSRRRTALFAGAIAALGLLTGCGTDHGTAGGPQKVPGTAAPATGDTTTGAAAGSTAPGGGSTTAGRTASPPGSGAPATTGHATASGTGAGTGSDKNTAAQGGRCHTSELRAAIGRMDPGAGQENFPLVLTNVSGRTCTVRGYPGAAFVDASGRQLGPDPKRSSGSPATVTLKPGASAWAGLTFSNPGVSGARTAKPAALIVTPPDERDHLTVKWTAGQVPVGGNSSSVFLTVLSPGTAP